MGTFWRVKSGEESVSTVFFHDCNSAWFWFFPGVARNRSGCVFVVVGESISAFSTSLWLMLFWLLLSYWSAPWEFSSGYWCVIGPHCWLPSGCYCCIGLHLGGGFPLVIGVSLVCIVGFPLVVAVVLVCTLGGFSSGYWCVIGLHC